MGAEQCDAPTRTIRDLIRSWLVLAGPISLAAILYRLSNVEPDVPALRACAVMSGSHPTYEGEPCNVQAYASTGGQAQIRLRSP